MTNWLLWSFITPVGQLGSEGLEIRPLDITTFAHALTLYVRVI